MMPIVPFTHQRQTPHLVHNHCANNGTDKLNHADPDCLEQGLALPVTSLSDDWRVIHHDVNPCYYLLHDHAAQIRDETHVPVAVIEFLTGV